MDQATNTGGVNDVCLDARAVRERYGGRPDMWLWRLLASDKDFPRPLVIRKKRYWRLSELLGWEEKTRRVDATAR